MMKKIFLLVTFFVLGKMWSYAQYPITQNIGSDSTIVVSKGALQSRLINVTYPDTATANLQRIRQYPGAQIATTSGGINLWVRNTTATAWLPINTGSGNNIYTIDGTLTGNRTLTGNNYSLTFTGLSQFLLTVGNQTFTVRSDSASLTRKLSYASNRGSTFTLYSLVDKNYVDSAIASSPAGTVTQINTNNNTGITGGPITSTGTLAIDTLLISTRAWRQKGVDSLQANINLKLNIVDTTGMLANYVNSVGYGLGKTSQTVYVDSASLSNYYLRRKDSLTATNPLGYVTQKILADTAAAIRSSDLGGTVTSVATNNGTGITGGTITTSGTLAIDTTIISTRAWRQKGVDSLQANINLKLNISDTASMLNPYLRKVDTASLSNRINQKLNISDTASMLSPYLRSNTAAATYVPQTRTLTINGTTQDLSANRTYNVGTVTSVGLTMPAAFNVANSPVTGSGTLAVTGAGLASQYIRGDGTLANFPGGGGGGGASVSYYLNGSVNQGTFGGNTYYQMNKTPILGAGTDFTTNTNGYIAQFITNAGDPALLNIPAGNWNFELFFSASSGGGTPTYYVELYKYDGTTFTLIASGSTNPDVIVNSAVDAYFSALPVPQTTLTLTDRLAVRIYVTPAGRTITLHTEDNNLCQVVTTFTTGITAINSLTAQVQYLTTGTSGTDFNISSLTDTHTFNLPVASGTNTGKLSNTDWTTFNNKVGGSLVNGYITKATGTNTIDTSQLFQSNGLIGIGTTSPTQKLQVSGNAYVNGQLFAGDTALSVYQVEGILNTPYVLGRKAVNNTLSTEARPTGVMGHVVGRGSIANRLQAANFYTTTDSASTANSTGSLRSVNAWTAHNGSGSLATAWGSYNIVQNKTTGTITNAYGSVSGVENRGATSTINKLHGTTTEIWNNYGGTIDTAFGQVISIYNNNAASNIGAVYGLSIGKGLITPTGGTHYWRNLGTIGTSYGLYLDSSIDVGTTKYALFSNSNSNSYLRGNLGLGTATPDSNLTVVNGALFQRGVRMSGLPSAPGTRALRINANGTLSVADTLTNGVSGSGTNNYITRFTGTTTIGNSSLQTDANGNLGMATSLSNWNSAYRAIQSNNVLIITSPSESSIGNNYYIDPTNNAYYLQNGAASFYTQYGNTHSWQTAPTGTTGGVVSFTERMRLTPTGLGIGTSPDSLLTVQQGAWVKRGLRLSGLPSAPGTRALRIDALGTISVADTLIDAGGTVTSVATNNGTGITGGTITTTGTLAIDTLLISTRAWRQKGVDSLQANINQKLNISDTASMLSPYLRTNVAAATYVPQTRTITINGTSQDLSANRTYNVGTVTSVATNTGTGITGGTITTSGTIAADTLLLSTRAWRQKGIDSVAALINSNVSGTTNYVAKFTGTNTIGNSQLFDNGTNVGIGTTSPTQKLTVYNGTSRGLIRIASDLNFAGAYLGTNSSSNRGASLELVAHNDFINSSAYKIFYDNDVAGGALMFSNAPQTSSYTSLSYTERMRLDASGNLLVGTTTVQNPAAGRGNITIGGTSSSILNFGYNGGDNGYIFHNATDIFFVNRVVTGALVFQTNSSERMRITSSGVVGIGTSSPVGLFEVKGDGVSYFTRGTKSILLNPNVVGGDVNALIETSTGMALAFGTNGSERMRIATTGAVRFNAYGSGSFTGTRAYDLSVDASGNIIEVPVGAGTITGSGTTNYIPKFTSSSAIGNSVLYESGGTIGINATSFISGSVLDVRGGTIVSTNSDLDRITINPASRSTSPAFGMANGSMAIYTVGAGVATPFGIGTFGGAPLIFGTANTERMRLDASGNLGLGVTPSAWNSSWKAFQFGKAGSIAAHTGVNAVRLSSNEYDGTYISTDAATRYEQYEGQHKWYNAPSGTAGSAISWTQAMTLDASGNLGIGTTSISNRLEISGSARVSGYYFISNPNTSFGAGTNNSTWAEINTGTAFNVRVNGGDRFIVNSSGNVGIGTTSPGDKLTVNGGIAILAGNSIYFNNPVNTANSSILSPGGGSMSLRSYGVEMIGLSENANILFSTGGTERMRITSGGNVGIGTSSPGYKTEIRTDNQNATQTLLALTNSYGGATDGARLLFQVANTGGNGAAITGKRDGGTFGIDLLFETSSGVGSAATEKMRITSTGNVGIGTTSPTQKLHIAGDVQIGESSGGEKLRFVGASNKFNFQLGKQINVDNGFEITPSTAAGGTTFSTPAFVVTSGGNVGIGTTADLARTTILSDANAQTIGLIGRSGDNISTIRWWNNAGNTTYTAIESNANYTNYNTVTNGYAAFFTNNTERMRITSGGNVLVGTTTDAGYKLDVNGTGRFVGPLNNPGIYISGNMNGTRPSSNEGLAIGQNFQAGTVDVGFWNTYLPSTFANTKFSWYQLTSASTSTELMTLTNSGNLGLGVTPNTWGGTGVKAFQFQNGSLAASLSFGALFGWNTYYDGSYRYVSNSSASAFLAAGNDFIWYNAPSGTAGNAISFTQAMTLDASGNLMVGTTSAALRLNLASNSSWNAGIRMTSGANTSGFDVGLLAGTLDATAYVYQRANADMIFGTNNTERMRITSIGNVGIGTTSPGYKLQVNGGSSGTVGLFAYNGAFAGTGEANIGLRFYRDNSESDIPQVKLRAYGTSNYTGNFAIDVMNGGTYPNTFTERFTIQGTTGNVGIGTTSPAYPLQVAGVGKFEVQSGATNNTAPTALIVANKTTGAHTSSLGSSLQFEFTNSGGAYSGGLISSVGGADPFTADLRFSARNYGYVEAMRITSGGNVLVGTTTDAGYKFDVAGSLRNTTSAYFATSSGSVGIGTTSPDASTKLQVESSSSSSLRVVSSAASGGDLYITSVNGSGESKIDKQGAAGPLTFYNNGSERMRLTSGGELLINTTTDAGAYPLQVNGSVYATAYYESSDLRLKNVLSERQGSDGINTITFKWKDGRDSLTHIGYAAQQVEKVLPDAVKTNPNGYKTINYDEVQSLKIANLEQEIAELKKIIKQLIDKK